MFKELMKAMMRPLSTLLSPASIVMAVSTAGLGQWIWMVHCCHRSVNIDCHSSFVFAKILRYGQLVGRFVGYTKLQIIWFLNWMMAHDSIPPPSDRSTCLHCYKPESCTQAFSYAAVDFWNSYPAINCSSCTLLPVNIGGGWLIIC